MLGAIIGDIIGSVYEFNNIKTKEFPLFGPGNRVTDDSVMTLAVAKALVESRDHSFADLSTCSVRCMRELGTLYPDAGYGSRFLHWLHSDNPKPYNSFGNGAAMRVSPVAYVSNDLERCKELARAVTKVTRDQPEGIRGAGRCDNSLDVVRQVG